MSADPINDDLTIERDGPVAIFTMRRPPHNFFDSALLAAIADGLAAVDADADVRVSLLRAEGRSFCAGADFSRQGDGDTAATIYAEAARIFARRKPLIAAVHGPAVGGGFGLALAADFRIVAPAARFHANFAALGLHHGFAITRSLPLVVGAQRARDLLLTARRVDAEEALRIGLADRLAPAESLDAEARSFAASIAANAPLALASIRAAMQPLDAETARVTMTEELVHQTRLFATDDFREGIRASAEKRTPIFTGS